VVRTAAPPYGVAFLFTRNATNVDVLSRLGCFGDDIYVATRSGSTEKTPPVISFPNNRPR